MTFCSFVFCIASGQIHNVCAIHPSVACHSLTPQTWPLWPCYTAVFTASAIQWPCSFTALNVSEVQRPQLIGCTFPYLKARPSVSLRVCSGICENSRSRLQHDIWSFCWCNESGFGHFAQGERYYSRLLLLSRQSGIPSFPHERSYVITLKTPLWPKTEI